MRSDSAARRPDRIRSQISSPAGEQSLQAFLRLVRGLTRHSDRTIRSFSLLEPLPAACATVWPAASSTKGSRSRGRYSRDTTSSQVGRRNPEMPAVAFLPCADVLAYPSTSPRSTESPALSNRLPAELAGNCRLLNAWQSAKVLRIAFASAVTDSAAVRVRNWSAARCPARTVRRADLTKRQRSA
jgi:hypothetical protein